MALNLGTAHTLKTTYPFFRQVINPLSMLTNSSGQRLISEDNLNRLNNAFISVYGQMQEGAFTEDLKKQMYDALEGLARQDQTAADAVEALNARSNEGRFLKSAKTILMPATGGKGRLRKCKTRGLAKRKTRGRGRRLAKKTRRS